MSNPNLNDRKSTGRPAKPATKSTLALQGRSRVTNGKQLFLEKGLGRSTWARRMRDLLQLHIADLGGDVSSAEHSICRRIATITTELELLEEKFASSKTGAAAADLALYLAAANSLRRLMETIGLKRIPHEVRPLSEILAELDRKKKAASILIENNESEVVE